MTSSGLTANALRQILHRHFFRFRNIEVQKPHFCVVIRHFQKLFEAVYLRKE